MTSSTSGTVGLREPEPAPPVAAQPARRRPIGALVRTVLSQTMLSVVALLFLTPIVWMVLSALKPGSEVFSVPPRPFGSRIEIGNFAEAWTYLPFGRFIANTVLVASVGTAITLVASALSGYAFARIDFRFRGGLFVLYLSTLIVPQEVIVIPMFLVMKQIGWVDSYQALILPWAFTAFGTFLLRQFFLTVPTELEEAAKLDGCGHLRILTRIILPVCLPALAVLAMFTFVAYWNSFLWPLIIVSDTDKMTVPLGLQLFLGQQGQRWGLVMAASTMSMVAPIALLVALHRYLIKGVALTGLGGR